jgi:tetratricopeptide (TPR) repeat protein
MKKKRIADSKVAPKLDTANQTDRKRMRSFDAAALALLSISICLGWGSFRNQFSTSDRTICCTLVAIGFLVALYRSNWRGDLTRLRIGIAIACWVLASLLIFLGTALGNPQWCQLSLAPIAIGWCVGRIRGEAILYPLFLGAALTIPRVIDLLEFCRFFEWLEPTTLSITSLLADTVGLPHVVSEGSVLFKHGIADRFAGIGNWDSAVSLFGVSVFCILVLRRSLLASIATIGFSVLIWTSVRGATWVILSSLASRNQAVSPWTEAIGLYAFVVAILLVISLDQFFAILFKPIPFELFNPESPLVAFAWNWICGLPKIELRIPADNKIALRWRTRVKLAGKSPSFQTDRDWLRIESINLLFHPIAAIGSTIDWARGWRASRNWLGFFATLPSLTLLVAFFSVLGFTMFSRKDGQAVLFTEESLQLCSTRTLEIACERQQEPEFSKAIGAVERVETDTLLEGLSDDSKRYLELLCLRILAIEPNNQVAKYRLGLIASLNDRHERAVREMREITGNQFGDFPQANAWLSKALVIKKSAGETIEKNELLDHLDKASKWKEADFRLLLVYSRLLEELGDNKKSVEMVRQVVTAKPELILELAQLCARIGDDEGRIAAANQAEDYFGAKINFPNEKELDRLSVADAMLLSNRIESAAEVLTEGLRQNLGGPRTVRQLSEVQRLLYLKSIKSNADGTFEVNLDLLETMADTDATNPSVSSEIAKLLVFKIKPTTKLLDVLRKNIALGITDVPSLLILGEGYFANGNFIEAQRYWELAVTKEPDNFVALNNLASCLVAISASNVDRALELVTKAGTLAQNNPDVLDTWGEVLALANRHREAITKFEMAIRLNVARIDIRRKLVAAYEALGMTEMAESQTKVIADLEKANAKNPAEAK